MQKELSSLESAIIEGRSLLAVARQLGGVGSAVERRGDRRHREEVRKGPKGTKYLKINK